MSVRSPCISMCWDIDLKKKVCQGCYRSLDEVETWHDMTDPQKRATLKRCKKRSKEAGGKHGSQEHKKAPLKL